ncbi:hypothetical protein HY839_02915 [Candidatus Azambacteria bacterium]|nr:hypothetical protein [Candidatus Azambacteria bacterium]
MNTYYQVLGAEKAHEICESFGLAPAEEAVVREIFSRWDLVDMDLKGEDKATVNDVKAVIAANTLKSRTRRRLICFAVSTICNEAKKIDWAIEEMNKYNKMGKDLH